MSAAKMVADSTSSLPEREGMKRKKKHKKDKSKPKKQKILTKKKKATSEEENTEDSDLDLSHQVMDIGSYIRDRKEMLEQMFKSLKGGSLQRHIPDVLKELTLDDLKSRCQGQLDIMSKKRIRRILAGDDPDEISSSGTDDSSDEENNNEENEDKTEEDSEYEEITEEIFEIVEEGSDNDSSEEIIEIVEEVTEEAVSTTMSQLEEDIEDSVDEEEEEEDDGQSVCSPWAQADNGVDGNDGDAATNEVPAGVLVEVKEGDCNKEKNESEGDVCNLAPKDFCIASESKADVKEEKHSTELVPKTFSPDNSASKTSAEMEDNTKEEEIGRGKNENSEIESNHDSVVVKEDQVRVDQLPTDYPEKGDNLSSDSPDTDGKTTPSNSPDRGDQRPTKSSEKGNDISLESLETEGNLYTDSSDRMDQKPTVCQDDGDEISTNSLDKGDPKSTTSPDTEGKLSKNSQDIECKMSTNSPVIECKISTDSPDIEGTISTYSPDIEGKTTPTNNPDRGDQIPTIGQDKGDQTSTLEVSSNNRKEAEGILPITLRQSPSRSANTAVDDVTSSSLPADCIDTAGLSLEDRCEPREGSEDGEIVSDDEAEAESSAKAQNYTNTSNKTLHLKSEGSTKASDVNSDEDDDGKDSDILSQKTKMDSKAFDILKTKENLAGQAGSSQNRQSTAETRNSNKSQKDVKNELIQGQQLCDDHSMSVQGVHREPAQGSSLVRQPDCHGNQASADDNTMQRKGGKSRKDKFVPKQTVKTVLRVKKLTDGQIEELVQRVTEGNQAIELLGRDNITSTVTTQVTPASRVKSVDKAKKDKPVCPPDDVATVTTPNTDTEASSNKSEDISVPSFAQVGVDPDQGTSQGQAQGVTRPKGPSGVRKKGKKKGEAVTAEPAVPLTKNQMELLELEMRARAIKSMLMRQDGKD